MDANAMFWFCIGGCSVALVLILGLVIASAFTPDEDIRYVD